MEDKSIKGELVYEDVRTGEIQPAPQQAVPTIGKYGTVVALDLGRAGTLKPDDKTLEILMEELKPEDVQIRPDGFVYLPWTWYARRLNRAFGVLGWALIPHQAPVVKADGEDVLVVWLNWLVVDGVPIAQSGGEMTYRPSNRTMSQGDAIEGAKSNSLARNCKMLGMALELWEPDWVEDWKKKYAVQCFNDKNRKVWARKDRIPAGWKLVNAAPGNVGNAPKKAPASPASSESTKESAETMTGNQVLAKGSLVEQMVKDSGKPAVVVCKYLGSQKDPMTWAAMAEAIKALP